MTLGTGLGPGLGTGLGSGLGKSLGKRRWLRQAIRVGGTLAVILGLVGICLTTEPDQHVVSAEWLDLWLILCQAMFTTQFAVRAWINARLGRARRYLGSVEGIVDAIAALALPAALAAGISEPDVWLAGISWLLKLINANPRLQQLSRVVVREGRSLAAVGALFVIILCTAATVLYLQERHVQPVEFGSLRQSLWWSIVTLSTTGYGDVIPKTFPGRAVAAMVMVLGLGVFGLWTGIIATGFAAEARRRDFLVNWNLVARVPFLKSLSAVGLAALAQTLRRLDVPEGTVLFRRGQEGDCMYFIVAGEVEVDVRPQPVYLKDGNFFGEMALLSGAMRNATVTTVRPSTLLVLDVMDFRTLTAQYGELARAVDEEARKRANPEAYTG